MAMYSSPFCLPRAHGDSSRAFLVGLFSAPHKTKVFVLPLNPRAPALDSLLDTSFSIHFSINYLFLLRRRNVCVASAVSIGGGIPSLQ